MLPSRAAIDAFRLHAVGEVSAWFAQCPRTVEERGRRIQEREAQVDALETQLDELHGQSEERVNIDDQHQELAHNFNRAIRNALENDRGCETWQSSTRD